MAIVDGTQMYEDAIRRIREMEQLNALLAEQVDRQRVVINAARTWHENDKGFTRIALHTAIDNYDRVMKKLAACSSSASSVSSR